MGKLGFKHSAESKAKMSLAAKKRGLGMDKEPIRLGKRRAVEKRRINAEAVVLLAEVTRALAVVFGDGHGPKSER